MPISSILPTHFSAQLKRVRFLAPSLWGIILLGRSPHLPYGSRRLYMNLS